MNRTSFFVIAATDEPVCNHKIAELCKQKRIPVNVVDDAEECSFLFPALVTKGNLTVGISTGGSSPTAAVCLKEQIAEMIPEHFDEILEFLHEQRDKIKKEISNEQLRHSLLKKLFFAAVAKGKPLQSEEVSEMIQKEEIQ
ncbi:siroheme synthase [gut metagenome]|uniref:precorrin-2 dehydrogenase n=1 Tax=gut metagenome TaxID=749906 RepID=J9CRQ5_9ZZZZ